MPFKILIPLICIWILYTPIQCLSQIRMEFRLVENQGLKLGQNIRINENNAITSQFGPNTIIWRLNEENSFIYPESSRPHSLSYSHPVIISDNGAIIGHKAYLYNDDPEDRYEYDAYYWDQATGFIDIRNLELHGEDTVVNTRVSGINNSGVVTGFTHEVNDSSDSKVKGFIWTQQTGVMEIPTVTEESEYYKTAPKGINNNGLVFGEYEFDYQENGSRSNRGFIYDAENGSRDPRDVDPIFFSDDRLTLSDVNDSNVIIGTVGIRTNLGFSYDLEKKSGQRIFGFGVSNIGTRAELDPRSINNHNAIVGIADDWERHPFQDQIKTSVLWREGLDVVRLSDYTDISSSTILPEGETTESLYHEVQKINDSGNISGFLYGVLENNDPYLIPFVLIPKLHFEWGSPQQIVVNGVNRFEFTHLKSSEEDTLDPLYFNQEIELQYSFDLLNWITAKEADSSVFIFEDDEQLTVQIASDDLVFVRAILSPL